jgi:hypothetical protein
MAQEYCAVLLEAKSKTSKRNYQNSKRKRKVACWYNQALNQNYPTADPAEGNRLRFDDDKPQ